MSLLTRKIRGFRLVDVVALGVLVAVILSVYLAKTMAGRERADEGLAHVVGVDLAIDVRLAHAPRDELRDLGAEVEDQDLVVHDAGSDRRHEARRALAAEILWCFFPSSGPDPCARISVHPPKARPGRTHPPFLKPTEPPRFIGPTGGIATGPGPAPPVGSMGGAIGGAIGGIGGGTTAAGGAGGAACLSPMMMLIVVLPLLRFTAPPRAYWSSRLAAFLPIAILPP